MQRIIFIVCFLPFAVPAQELAGVWTGYIENAGKHMPYEIVINEEKGKLNGYSMTIFTFEGVENVGVKSVKLKNKKGNVLLEDDELLYHNYTTPPRRVKLYGDLYLKVSNAMMILSGSFITRTLDLRVEDKRPFTGRIELRKQTNIAATRLTRMLEELNLSSSVAFLRPQVSTIDSSRSIASNVVAAAPNNASAKVAQTPQEPTGKPKPAASEKLAATPAAAANVKSRKTEILREITIKSDTLLLTLYDNGEIDGDTVSVLLNNRVIIEKTMLTATAKHTTIQLTKDLGDSFQLTLYAENLGRIAPNTGVLLIQDAGQKHEIRFAGDFEKNAAIILRRKR
ncbi:MAG TPA: hypothetical protein VEZ55_05120 [Chitinophagaceae bacterium]|nr:hypothetical protein [Chitinophagaceae bacterium]